MYNSFVDWSASYGDRISVKKLDQEICRNHPSPAKHHEQHEFIVCGEIPSDPGIWVWGNKVHHLSSLHPSKHAASGKGRA